MNTIKTLSAISRFYPIVIAISLLTYSCNEAVKSNPEKDKHTKPDSSSKESAVYIDLRKVLEKKNAEALTIPVKYDHFFKSPKKYKGYFIDPIIDSVVKLKG